MVPTLSGVIAQLVQKPRYDESEYRTERKLEIKMVNLAEFMIGLS